MSMKMMNAAYLVDGVALLSLQEKQEGVEFHCFDMDRKVQIAEGHIGWNLLCLLRIINGSIRFVQ